MTMKNDTTWINPMTGKPYDEERNYQTEMDFLTWSINRLAREWKRFESKFGRSYLSRCNDDEADEEERKELKKLEDERRRLRTEIITLWNFGVINYDVRARFNESLILHKELDDETLDLARLNRTLG